MDSFVPSFCLRTKVVPDPPLMSAFGLAGLRIKESNRTRHRQILEYFELLLLLSTSTSTVHGYSLRKL